MYEVEPGNPVQNVLLKTGKNISSISILWLLDKVKKEPLPASLMEHKVGVLFAEETILVHISGAYDAVKLISGLV